MKVREWSVRNEMKWNGHENEWKVEMSYDERARKMYRKKEKK